ncbi:MAG: RNA 2',3'-cyclic phosphodiesterase, partial [bacterium]
EEGLEKLGFPRERRPFSPHLTIARFKGPASVGGDVLQDAGECGAFEAVEMTLFQSILRPEGAEYIPLQRFKLEG